MEKLTPQQRGISEASDYAFDRLRAIPEVLLICLAIALQFPAWQWAIDKILNNYCPASSFLTGRVNEFGSLWIGIGAFCVAMFCRYWIFRYWRGTTAEEARRNPAKHVIWSYLSLIGAMMAAALAIAGQSKFCLTPAEILIKQSPWVAERAYAWNDVVAIWPSCRKPRRRKDGWHGGYQLVMSDNRAIDILLPVTDFEAAHPHLSQALAPISPQPYFSAENVDKDCGYSRVDLLLNRP